MNKTLITGNVTKDATFSNVSEKQDVVNFTVATSRSYKDQATGEYKNTASQFHPCSRFVPKGSGEALAALIKTGRHLEVEGRVQTGKERPGKTRAGEEKKFVNKSIIVEDIVFGAKGKEQAA